ncbi:hypothetical protein GGP57_002244 [Salinibacter ruber]|nr:hypothetical protein [Salinibacter ruber]MCS3714614.1 hypothetical protein [Salinibacter ruber]
MQVERDGVDSMVRWTIEIHVVPDFLGAIHDRFDLLKLPANVPCHGEIGLPHISRPSRRTTSRSDAGHCSRRTRST